MTRCYLVVYLGIQLHGASLSRSVQGRTLGHSTNTHPHATSDLGTPTSLAACHWSTRNDTEFESPTQ